MFTLLKRIDPNLLTINSGAGQIAISAHLQGRIFCELDGEMIHRFSSEAAAYPSSERFNNIGGNSLWPGPEGGDFAFNYLPESGWLVQDAINKQAAEIREAHPQGVRIGKRMSLRNRKGISMQLDSQRTIMPIDAGIIAKKHKLKTVAYRTLDEFQAVNKYNLEDVLFCAWSLEQFPGGDGVIAFGRTGGNAAGAINPDYYGDPGAKLQCEDHFFRLELGGHDRFQIGVNHHSHPELIGAYDCKRSLLFLRRAWRQEGGLYFNIADNKQPRGAFSAADSYSIFNGGELEFFELETIAPLQLDEQGHGVNSLLWSETMIFKGIPEHLMECLEDYFKVPASLIRD